VAVVGGDSDADGDIGGSILSAVAEHEIPGAHAAGGQIGCLLQHHISSGMAMGIVDYFETVQVECG